MPPTEPQAPAPPTEVPSPTPANSGNRSVAMASLLIMVVFLIVVSLLAFHTTKKTSPRHLAAAAPAKIEPAMVNISSTSFTPATVYVKVGQAVDWTNTDTANHSIASDNAVPVFKSKQILGNNDSFSYVFNKAGTYPYHDNFNTMLAGIVIVK
jgi:plastocyanin